MILDENESDPTRSHGTMHPSPKHAKDAILILEVLAGPGSNRTQGYKLGVGEQSNIYEMRELNEEQCH